MSLRSILSGLFFGLLACAAVMAQDVYPLGDQRELFCDDTMVV